GGHHGPRGGSEARALELSPCARALLSRERAGGGRGAADLADVPAGASPWSAPPVRLAAGRSAAGACRRHDGGGGRVRARARGRVLRAAVAARAPGAQMNTARITIIVLNWNLR